MKTRLVLIVIALSAMICVSAHAAITDGIVSAWLFNDGTAKDLTGKNNGIIHGATKAAGKYGSCLEFNGVDNYVEIPDSSTLQIPEAITVAGWMYVVAGGNLALDHAAICAKARMIGWSADYSWRIATTSTTSMTWGRCDGTNEGYFATSGVIPATEQWVHVALTSGAPGAATPMRAYVNGEDITGVSGESGMNIVSPYSISEGIPVEIGVGRAQGGTVGNDSFFSGRIDDVVVYNRGLTADEINALMGTDLAAVVTAVNPAGKIASVWGKIKGE
jgi:hypothetical protein